MSVGDLTAAHLVEIVLTRYVRVVDIQLSARIAAPPEAVWGYVTDPAKMNDWSLAPVRLLETGDGGAADGVGATRRVVVRSRSGTVRLLEVVEHSEPPARFVYRVVAGPALLRHHRGELRLRRHGEHTELDWHVRFDLAVPGLAVLASAELRSQLRASLDALARVARGAAPSRCAEPRTWRENDLRPLRAAAGAVLLEQRALADELAEANDPKRWFARVYQYVTEGQLALVDHRQVSHREWVLHLIPRFHLYYTGNLARWRAGERNRTESSWALAFAFAESSGPRPAAQRLIGGLLLGVRAHIEEDLPRALAEVWLDRFADRCDYARFRADYLLMSPVFRAAADRLLAELPREFLPWSIRLARRVLPSELQDAMTNRRGYDVPNRRAEAFERGRRLVEWMQQRQGRG